MKQILGMAVTGLLALALAGCASRGTRSGESGITTYGTIDVGVSHTSK